METQTKEIALSKLVILATIAGMRSMLAPALLALNLKQKDKKLFNQEGIGFLGNPTTTKTLAIMATAELGLDKLPFLPSRLSKPQFTGRVLMGATVGALTYQLSNEKATEGAIVGSLVAASSSLLFFTLRKILSKSRILPEPLTGLVEDMFAFYLAGKFLKLNNQVESDNDLTLLVELERI